MEIAYSSSDVMELEFAELHTPLFLAGTNHGLKLHAGSKGIKIEYHRQYEEIWVYFNHKVAIVPKSNAASMTPRISPAADKEVPKIMEIEKPTRRGPVKAQVGGPMDHVHAGLGNGKTRD